ncbi:MAG: response regulator receiver protein [Paenibacillus sp.]|nr:response regulator receiver protein [Paenibacillus sp.]
MYSIGELSKIVKISIDALRYYDDIGLLKPYHIDTINRYRYYSAEQVNDIITIMDLKQFGFSLDAIKELLCCTDTERIQSAFHSRLQQLTVERSSIERTIERLKNRIKSLEGEVTMNKKTVLIIDDAAFMRQVLRDIIERQGQRYGLSVIGEASSGEEGVSKYDELKPDVVILDIGLPGIDGIQVAERIKEMDENAKIVICSARGQLRTTLESLQAGANHFIVKPFRAEVLLEILHTTLESAPQGEFETIASILADSHIENIGEPLRQESINDLLELCTKGVMVDSPEWTEFWGNLRILEPISPLQP